MLPFHSPLGEDQPRKVEASCALRKITQLVTVLSEGLVTCLSIILPLCRTPLYYYTEWPGTWNLRPLH